MKIQFLRKDCGLFSINLVDGGWYETEYKYSNYYRDGYLTLIYIRSDCKLGSGYNRVI